jgi:hypothetical protein
LLVRVRVPSLPDGVAATLTFDGRACRAQVADGWLLFDLTRDGGMHEVAPSLVGPPFSAVSMVNGTRVERIALTVDDGRAFPVEFAEVIRANVLRRWQSIQGDVYSTITVYA